MSSLRRAVLAGAAALLMLAVTASAAMATTLHSGSATGPLYSGSLTFTNIGNVLFTNNSLGTTTCTSSTWGGTVNTSGAGSLSSATFAGCTNSFGSSCPFTTTSFNWTFSFLYSPVSGGRDGTFTLTVPTGGISYSCGGLGSCTASGTITADWFNANNANKPASSFHGEIRFMSAAMTGNAQCGNVTYTATYAVTGSGGVDVYVEA